MTPFTAPAERTGDMIRFGVHAHSDSGGHVGFGADGDSYRARLFAGDELLSERMSAPGSQPYRVLGAPASYRLTLTARRTLPGWTYATETDTTWTFGSSRPAEGETTRLPLLQVDYALKLDEYNLARSPWFSWFTLRVGHVPGSTGPAIASVKAWASLDDGGTWRPIPLIDQGGGVRLAVVLHPTPTSDAVSLRVKATDTAGTGIDQTILRAYGLSR